MQHPIDLAAEENVHGERHVLYCVPVPGENAWATQISASTQHNKTLGGMGGWAWAARTA